MSTKFIKISFLVLSITITSCKEKIQNPNHEKMEHKHDHHGDANAHMNKTSFEDLVKHFEDPERIKTQKPDEVINLLGDIKGKKIIDIGAGTGYFAFRMVNKGAKVIAADVDKRFQDYIQKKQDSLEIPSSKLETRLVDYDDCKLKNQEADIVIIVDTYHHIENRIDYFKKVKTGLKPNGRLLVLDYKKMEMPIPSPPMEMKLEAKTIQTELEKAGFKIFSINEKLMPYQYTIIAQ
jgi:cyclopropane fatty-acyl-phospholipid synthase-like methyltransferase